MQPAVAPDHDIFQHRHRFEQSDILKGPCDSAGDDGIPEDLDPDAVRAGGENLAAHVEMVRKYGVPVVVATNALELGIDIGALDGRGYLHLSDRLKDVIKSGGEWISSIDLENAAAENIRIVNLSLGKAVEESAETDPLVQAVEAESGKPAWELDALIYSEEGLDITGRTNGAAPFERVSCS